MGYTNSKLVDCKVLSPNHSGKRTHKIDRITPHCVVGQLSAEAIGACFPSGRGASANYGVGYDGRQCLIVEEQNRSWCTSSADNDQRAITIEVASDKVEPYSFTNEAYKGLLELCIDICKRNGFKKVLWFGDKEKSLKYEPKEGECVLTVHRWFANKSCPGNWLYARMYDLADSINNELSGSKKDSVSAEVEIKQPTSGKYLYRVQCGAFFKKKDANRLLCKLDKKNVDGFIVCENELYKVQVGSYSNEKNAKKLIKKIEELGIYCYITTVPMASQSFIPRKSVEQIAEEIWLGKCSDDRWSSWGAGETRKQRLESAGYNYNAVQQVLNKMYG